MKFKCGLTQEECDAKAEARYNALDKDWKPWFAWFPISVAEGKCRWLEWVERKRRFYWFPDVKTLWIFGWEYRDKENG